MLDPEFLLNLLKFFVGIVIVKTRLQLTHRHLGHLWLDLEQKIGRASCGRSIIVEPVIMKLINLVDIRDSLLFPAFVPWIPVICGSITLALP